MSQKPQTTRAEIAEDFRRVGVALIITGLVGAIVKYPAFAAPAIVVSVVGFFLCAAGYILSALDRRTS